MRAFGDEAPLAWVMTPKPGSEACLGYDPEARVGGGDGVGAGSSGFVAAGRSGRQRSHLGGEPPLKAPKVDVGEEGLAVTGCGPSGECGGGDDPCVGGEAPSGEAECLADIAGGGPQPLAALASETAAHDAQQSRVRSREPAPLAPIGRAGGARRVTFGRVVTRRYWAG